MAEYRGLTVRIGADTSRFTAALKATQSAIASTQKNLRQLKQALTFDPGSKNASALYVGELQSQAVAASAKLQELRKHIREVESATPKTNGLSTFKKVAEDTDNAALSAQRAKAAFNDVTDALAQIYTNISAKSHDAFDLDDTEVKQLTQSLKDAGIASKEVKTVLGSSMESIREELTSKGKASVDQIEQIMKKVEAFKNQGVTINVTNSSMDTITSELQRLVEAGKISQDEMDETIVRVSRLKSVWTSASNAYDDAKVIDQLHNDSVEVTKLEAQVKSLAEQMVDATRNAFADGLDDDIQKLRNLGTELDRAEGGFKRADEAFRLDPSNVDLSISRMQALDEATEAAKREAESLTDIIGQYEAAGIDKVAASTENLTQATADAKQNLVDANAAVIMQEREIDEFLDDISKRSVDGNPLNILDAAPKYRELTSQLDELKEKQAEAQESYQRLVNAGDYTEKVAELETVNNKITEFGNTARDNEAVINAFAESMRNAFSNRLESLLEGDKSALEGLGDETRRVMDDLNRVERAMELNPSSIERVAERSKALETAMAATSREMEQTQRILDRYSAAGIDKVAESSTNLTQDLKDAEAYAQAAAIALASYKTNVSDIDSGALEFFEENLSNAVARVNELKSAMDFNDKKGHLADLQNEYTELGNKIDNTTAHLRALANAQVGRVGGGIESAIASLNSDLDALSGKTDAAVSHFEALSKAYDVKPTNLEMAKARLDALAEATTKAKEEASELDSQIARLSGKGFDKVLASTKNIAKATDDARKRWEDAEAAVKIWQERLSKAQTEVERIESSSDSAGDELKEAQEQAAKIAENLNKASGAADRARERFTELSGAGELAELNTRRDAITGVIADLEGETENASKGISTALFMALQEVGQEAKRALDSVVSATTSLDDALTNVKKTVDTTEEGYETLKESAVELSKVQPIDASTILQAEALGGQLGFAADEVEKFSEVATGLDVATNMDWNDAASNMARFFNIMSPDDKSDIENYGSAIVELGNNFATTESEISDMALRIAGVGAQIGLSKADVLGLATALTSVGLSAEAGGSSISQIMVKIDKAVANGTSGIEGYAKQMGMSVDEFVTYLSSLDDDAFSDVAKSFGKTAKSFRADTLDSVDALNVWAETANMSSAEFVEAWTNRPVEALTALFSGMDEASEEGSNLNLLLDDLGIKTIRQSDVARRVANASELTASAVRSANDAYQANTALSTEVARRNESLSAQMDIMANSFDAVKAELGEGLLPLVKVGVSLFQDLSNVLNDVPTEVKTGIIAAIGALAGFATTYPVIHQISNAFEDLIERIAKAGGIASVMSSKFTALGGGIKSLGVGIKSLLSFIISPAGMATAALGALGITAAALAVNWKKNVLDVQKQQEDFNSAIEEMNKTTSSMASSMEAGKGAVSSFTAEFKSKTVKELTEDLDEFNKSIKGMMDPVDKSNALLGEYRSVIEKFGGTGEATGKDLAELEWAVKGINDVLGTNYTAQDILNDKYVTEEGEIDNLCAQIDKLIEKRQEQARVDAAQNMYTKSLEKQNELKMNVDFAQEDLDAWDDLYEEQLAHFEELDNGVHSHEELEKAAAASVSRTMGATREELERNAEAAQKALDAVGREVEYSKQVMADATTDMANNSETLASYIEGAFQGWDIDWSDALERNGISLDDFSQKAEDAGITLEDLQSIADDPDVFFSQWVDECEGDIDALIAKIQSYNGTKVENESIEGEAQRIHDFVDTAFQGWDIDWSDALERSGITVDDFAQKAEDAGIKLGDLKDVADDPSVTFAQWVDECEGDIDELIAKIQEYNDTHIEEKKAEVKVEAANVEENVRKLFGGGTTIETTQTTTAVFEKDDAEAAVQDYKGDVESVPEETNTTAKANTADAEKSLSYLITLANSVPSSITINIKGDASNFNRTLANARASSTVTVDGPRAAGALRYHADGVILNRPTWIGGRDIAGEAGAEAIIPLTNRRYVQPFADTVADGMMSKLDQMTGTTNNYVINGLTVAPDSALARAMDATFNEAQRYSRMGKR